MTNLATPQQQTPDRSDPAGSPVSRWTSGRVSLLVLGMVTLLFGAGMLISAGVLKAVDSHWRDGDYLTTAETPLSTPGYALAFDDIDLSGLSGDWLGEARVRAASREPDASLFVGVARTDDAQAYLRDVQYSTVDEVDDPETRYVEHAGGAPSVEPTGEDIWISQASGSGTQTLRWTPTSGDWSLVFMNEDGSSDVQVTADVGATAPLVQRVTWALLIFGTVFTLAGAALMVLQTRRTTRTTRTTVRQA
ncbi:MAG TPA: hypothetical protein VMT27_04730 [Actinomycetes bacterium]|nr:hypothetical protein [Actinomycetes bacterium]